MVMTGVALVGLGLGTVLASTTDSGTQTMQLTARPSTSATPDSEHGPQAPSSSSTAPIAVGTTTQSPTTTLGTLRVALVVAGAARDQVADAERRLRFFEFPTVDTVDAMETVARSLVLYAAEPFAAAALTAARAVNPAIETVELQQGPLDLARPVAADVIVILGADRK